MRAGCNLNLGVVTVFQNSADSLGKCHEDYWEAGSHRVGNRDSGLTGRRYTGRKRADYGRRIRLEGNRQTG